MNRRQRKKLRRGEFAEGSGYMRLDVVVLRAGLTASGTYYSPEVLKQLDGKTFGAATLSFNRACGVTTVLDVEPT